MGWIVFYSVVRTLFFEDLCCMIVEKTVVFPDWNMCRINLRFVSARHMTAPLISLFIMRLTGELAHNRVAVQEHVPLFFPSRSISCERLGQRPPRRNAENCRERIRKECPPGIRTETRRSPTLDAAWPDAPQLQRWVSLMLRRGFVWNMCGISIL